MNNLLLILALYQASPQSSGSIVVEVKSMSEVAGRSFKLSEIAVVTGDKAMAVRAGEVLIGVSPLPGLSRSLFKSDIIARLRGSGFDLNRFTVQFPDGVKVFRLAAEVSQQELVDAALQSLEGKLPEGSDIELTAGDLRISVPPGERKITAGSPRFNSLGTQVSVPLSIQVAGSPVRHIDVSFRIQRRGKAWVASRDLPAGTVLAEGDLVEAEVTTTGRTETVTDIAGLLGKTLSRRLAINQPITHSMVKDAEAAIAAGAVINVVSAAGGIQITARGTARSSGKAGGTIRVLLTELKREVTGTVMDGKTVRLEVQP